MAGKFSKPEKLTMSYKKNETELPQDDRCIQDFIRLWNNERPGEEAFVFVSDDETREAVTWRDLYENSLQYARAFLYLGLKQGEIVGISMRANPQCLYLHFGAIFAGAIPMDIIFTMKNCQDIISLLNTLTECHTIILDPNQDNISWSVFRSFFTPIDERGKVSSPTIPSVKYLIPTRTPKDDQKCFIFPELLKHSNTESQKLVDHVDPTSIAVLVQTSGSTGLPKAVAYTHRVLIQDGVRFGILTGRRAYTKSLFNWSNCWPRNVINGETWISPSSTAGSARYSIELVIKAARRERCSVLYLMPAAVEDIGNSMTTDSEPLIVDSIYSSGQYATNKVAKCRDVLGCTFTNAYGSTEALDVLKKRVKRGEIFEDGCCGVPVEGVEVKIVDDNGDIVPVNTKGELMIRSPTMFTGYYNAPQKTRSVLTEDGWFKSDDIARMTENGEIYVEGRKSDVIICRSTNIFPALIENALLRCPGIKHAVAVPVPHKSYYQEVCACIIVERGYTVSEATVKQFCEDYFTDKTEEVIVLPQYYLFLETFPVTWTGKFSRKKLTEQAVEWRRQISEPR